MASITLAHADLHQAGHAGTCRGLTTAQPQIEVVARDRNGGYGCPASHALPAAVPVSASAAGATRIPSRKASGNLSAGNSGAPTIPVASPASADQAE